MGMKMSAALGAALSSAVLLSGCSDGEAPEPDSVAGTSTALPDFHGDGEEPVPAAAAPLSWDADEKAKVRELAGEAMRLYARPDVSEETWTANLQPLLSDQAQEDYSYVDPRNVPVTKVTGPVRLVPMSSDLVSIARVPTDAGLYAVTLSRTAEEPRWVVERFTPPEEEPDGDHDRAEAAS